jgi:TolA-binding protein
MAEWKEITKDEYDAPADSPIHQIRALEREIKELKGQIELLKKNHSIEKEQFQADLLIKDQEMGRLMNKIK